MKPRLREVPPVIPVLRNPDDWQTLRGRGIAPKWVFLLGGTVDAVAQSTAILQKHGWIVFIHVDMVRGLANDAEGLRFLADYASPDGIISTHSTTITHAKRADLWTIQRIFLLDSQSITTGIQQVLSTRPDAVETLPGTLPEATRRIVKGVPCPVIAGGLVSTSEEVTLMQAAGVRGISTSNQKLWPKHSESSSDFVNPKSGNE